MKEEFKTIAGFPDYQVSNLGNVFSIRANKILKKFSNPDGYVLYKLYEGKKPSTLKAHRLVALNFIDNPTNKTQVNHKNGIKSDNNLSNLEWVSKSENQIHAHKTNLQTKIGERMPCLKISPDGFLLEVFYSKSKAAEITGIPRKQIYKSIKKDKLIGGYLWR